jgi:hypothetical protein
MTFEFLFHLYTKIILFLFGHCPLSFWDCVVALLLFSISETAAKRFRAFSPFPIPFPNRRLNPFIWRVSLLLLRGLEHHT